MSQIKKQSKLRKKHNAKSTDYKTLKYKKKFRVCDLLDYSADDLTGKSMYSLVHAADVHKIKQTHVDCKLHLCVAMMIQVIQIPQ